MRVPLICTIIGDLLRHFALAFLLPLLLALWDQQWVSAGHFALSMAITFGAGSIAPLLFRVDDSLLFQRLEALAVVTFSWLAMGIFGALPYVFSGIGPIDALFESISGFTTTGATILTDFSLYDRSFYLWRAMTQWFGGLGVIALFVVVLPRLGVAGRQLFFAEASGAPSDAVSPQVRQAARRLWVLYSALTLLLVVLLMFAGMGLYEAVCHAFTTLAAGGFSPNPSSVAGYNNPAVEWILVPFMILSGASFTLQYKAYTSDPRAFFRDGEFVLYFVVCAIGALGAAAYTYAGDVELSLRQGWFQSASLISSTGFASTDYNLWNDSARALMVLMMLVGGCAGSAAGGPKAIRYLLTFKHIGREITRTIHPHAILPVKYKGVVIRRSVLRAVSILVFLYLISYFAVGLFLVLLGNDLVTGFSASLACLGNVGPGFGPAGPMGNFAGFSPLAKFVLTIGMLLGRLEIVTVLALLHRDFWGNLRWRADK